MKEDIHYVINNQKTSEDKAEVRLAIKRGDKVEKVVRIAYKTGPSKVIVMTMTQITKIKEI